MPQINPGATDPQAPGAPTPTGSSNPGGFNALPSGTGTLLKGIPDWEAALITYAVGLFVAELEDWGKLYVLGAWAVALGLSIQAWSTLSGKKAGA